MRRPRPSSDKLTKMFRPSLQREDAPLAAALVFGALVMFAQPLRFALSVAEDISRADQAKRQVTDMERLMTVSGALANTVDSAGFRTEVWRHVPAFVDDRQAWLAIEARGEWQWMIEPSSDAHDTLDLIPTLLQRAEIGQRRHQGLALFPLKIAGRATGLLAVQDSPPLTVVDESRIHALVAILSAAVKNVQLFEHVQLTSVSDALTGCFNRARGFEMLETELRRMKRVGRPLSIIMYDVDSFKAINDEHGHLVGDNLLRAVGETFRRTLRTSDIKCRYGGDEFLVILPDTPLEGADHVSDHVRRSIERLEISGRTRAISCRLSLGVAAAAEGEIDPVALVRRADENLYQDKRRRSPNLRLFTGGQSSARG